MQKPVSKNKLKLCEFNRERAEKKGANMDTVVNTIPARRTAIKQDSNLVSAANDNNEFTRDISKDIKEKDNYESKKEKEPLYATVEKHASVEVSKKNTSVQVSAIVDKLLTDKETSSKTSLKIDDTMKLGIRNTQWKSVVPNDIVDHAKVKEKSSEGLAAQKNLDNFSVSALRISDEEISMVAPIIEKKQVTDTSTLIQTMPEPPPLKYTYKEDQWSPINTSGKKIYDREFLMKLQFDPNSKIKPSNLPDFEVVLKDSTKANSTMDLRSFKDTSIIRHDALIPDFAKANINARLPPMSRKSHQGKPKRHRSKPNVPLLSTPVPLLTEKM